MIRAALLVALVLAGCGADAEGPANSSPGKTGGEAAKPKRTSGPWPKLPHCQPDASNCASARGTVLYVEAVDPDGDGDAHFVLASSRSITAPGITVLDIEKDLRPHPLPGIGDRLSAAGPVYPGSHGQKQIQATVLRVMRR